MEAWYEQVAEGETIICLGDVTVEGAALAHHQQWRRKALGTKWLVPSNHAVSASGQSVTAERARLRMDEGPRAACST